MKTYFPEFIDIKYLCKDIEGFRYGGLSKLASELNVNFNFAHKKFQFFFIFYNLCLTFNY
jgi:hypothetical protein